jgi:hypothetical protein
VGDRSLDRGGFEMAIASPLKRRSCWRSISEMRSHDEEIESAIDGNIIDAIGDKTQTLDSEIASRSPFTVISDRFNLATVRRSISEMRS